MVSKVNMKYSSGFEKYIQLSNVIKKTVGFFFLIKV